MKKINQIHLGAIFSYLALGISILTGLIYTPWMVSKIGQSNYGLYTLANSLISIFMLDFGLGSAVSRYVSKYRAENNQQGINDIIGIIYKLYIAIDIIIFVVLSIIYLFIGAIYVKLTPAELEQFRVLYVMVASFNLVAFPFSPLNGILNAYEKFVQLKICDLISKLTTVAFVVIALTVSSSVTMVVAANIFSQLFTILIKWCIVKSSVPIKINFKVTGKNLYKDLFGFTVWTTVISIMQRFTHSFAPSILGITASSVEIAVYSPAITLEGYFFMVAAAVNGLFLPRISRYIANNEEDNILKLMIKVGKYQIMVLGLIVVGFVCVGKDFMTLWMGPEYEKSYYLAIIILIPTMLASTQQIATTTLIAKKLIKYQAICMIITGIVGLAVSYVLSVYIASFGVCIGTAITAIGNIILFNIIYKKKANINVFVFFKKAYLRAIPCFAISTVAGIYLAPFITISGWTGLAVKGIVVAIIFAIVFFVGYFSNEEKKAIFQRVIRTIKKA